MDLSKIKAIDVHVHAEVSCHDPEDPIMGKFFDAASTYFKADRKRPTIPETIAHYRERQIAFVMFTVDMEAGFGHQAHLQRGDRRSSPATTATS